MKARGAAVQGGLAAVGLLVAYGTWQRQPEGNPGETVVIQASKSDLQKIRYSTEETKWVELERKGSGSGAAVWLKLAAKPELKVPEREVRGNEAADRLVERFAPLRGLRALGALDGAKLKELGLDTAKKKIEVTARGDKRSFVVGTPPVGGSAPYWKDERDGRVYVVEAVVSELDSAAVRMVNRALHLFKKTEFDGVKVSAGGKTRELTRTNPENPSLEKLNSKKTSKPDDLAKNWHDKIWALTVVEVLGAGEKPASGEPTPAMKVEYLMHGKSTGFIELAKGTPPAPPAPAASSAPPPPTLPAEIFARTEFTAGWVKLPQIADEVLKEVDKVVSGE